MKKGRRTTFSATKFIYNNNNNNNNKQGCDDTPSAPLHQLLRTISIFLAGDHPVVSIGASHISLRLQEIQSREWEEREQTNKRTICLGLTPSARQGVMQHSAFSVCICRLTLAWISSETSTKLLGMPTHPDRSSSLLWTLSHANSSLCCPVSTALSVVRRQLPSSSSFVQLPSRVPLPTSGHAEISSPKPFVWFRAKTDKGIVSLADLLHSVTGFYTTWNKQRMCKSSQESSRIR